MKRIRINESDIKRMVTECVRKIMKEEMDNHMLYNRHGIYDPSGSSDYPYNDEEDYDYYKAELDFMDNEELRGILANVGIQLYDEEYNETPTFEELEEFVNGPYEVEFDRDGELVDDGMLKSYMEDASPEWKSKLLSVYDDIINYAWRNAEGCYRNYNDYYEELGPDSPDDGRLG